MQRLVNLFPLWLLVGAGLALLHPPLFSWFLELGLVTPGLAVIMLGMGLTLEGEDFARVARRPGPALLGLALQYAVMPLAGVAAAELWSLPRAYAAGVILVCCCPGGTASNVVAYLARADVPLSVSMTALSTLLAPLATPLLASWLIGDRVEVEAMGLVRDTLMVVLLPVAAGVALRRFAPRTAARLLPYAPPAEEAVGVAAPPRLFGRRRHLRPLRWHDPLA
jgi:BASS family bile acid:Na+ symporter